ncbi:MAG: VOC family protein [Candidatus Lokiarchaeia archaeon]
MMLDITLNSLYICVKNMDRAIKFYENFFEQPIFKKDKIFSIFDIKGFRFCLFNNSEVNENVTWGDNCLPSFEVNDINKLIEKLKILEREIVFPLTKIFDKWVLEFKDTEGNDIEVYSKINNII